MGSGAEDENVGVKALSSGFAARLVDGDFPIIGLRRLAVSKEVYEVRALTSVHVAEFARPNCLYTPFDSSRPFVNMMTRSAAWAI